MIVKLEKGTHGEPDHVGSVDQPWKVFDELRVLWSMKTHTITPTVIRQDQQPARRGAE